MVISYEIYETSLQQDSYINFLRNNQECKILITMSDFFDDLII